MTVAQATRRIRNTKGSSYLTHGADDYDHRGYTKAQRHLSKALIEEALEADRADDVQEPRWMFVLAIYLIDGDKPWLDCWDVVGVYSTKEELDENISRFEECRFDWSYIDIDGDSGLSYEARLYHDQY